MFAFVRFLQFEVISIVELVLNEIFCVSLKLTLIFKDVTFNKIDVVNGASGVKTIKEAIGVCFCNTEMGKNCCCN